MTHSTTDSMNDSMNDSMHDTDQPALFAELSNEDSIAASPFLQDVQVTTNPSNPACTSTSTFAPKAKSGLFSASLPGTLPPAVSPMNDNMSLPYEFQHTPPYAPTFVDGLESLNTSPVQILPGEQHPVPVTDISPLSLYAQPISNRFPTPTASGPQAQSSVAPTAMFSMPPSLYTQLYRIAMPGYRPYMSSEEELSPDSTHSENNKGGGSTPDEAEESLKLGRSRKRKSSGEDEDDDDDDDDDPDSSRPVKKHNVIEKRYRTNLNDKIAALRDSVPTLRIISKNARGEDTTNDREALHGLSPASKLNKATVLSKAAEYIRHLEKRLNRIEDEKKMMQQRLTAFETIMQAQRMNGGIGPIQQSPVPHDSSVYLNTTTSTLREPDPPGMIPVPDDMKRILTQQSAVGRPYPVPPQPFQPSPALIRQQQILQQQQIQNHRWTNAGPYFGKLMVGSLAGLMILEAVRENEQGNERPEGRGLFAIPFHLLTSLASPSHFNVAGYTFSTAEAIHMAKMLAIFGLLMWTFIPSLFRTSPLKSAKMQPIHASLKAVPSLASPIHIRRQAWLTAIQTVWVPRHNFFLEAAALILKTMKLSIRNALGVRGYQLLTGLTVEQEAARVKAWTIALDAQLAGGDVEINKSRLTLTLLASGTLPDTPQRLMLKALHTRVLLWQLGGWGILSWLVGVFANEIAKSKWKQARHLNQILPLVPQFRKSTPSAPDDKPDYRHEVEELPEHLEILLQQDYEEVLTDYIVQRAYNLAWNHPTTHDVAVSIDGMDAVVDDPAVRSPMDAVAAWYSGVVLHRVLATSLAEENDIAKEDEKFVDPNLDLAIKAAPIGSNTQIRALVARALLVDEGRGVNIATAMQAIDPSINPDKYPEHGNDVPRLPDSPTSLVGPDPDSKVVLACAMAIAQLQRHSNPNQDILILLNNILHGLQASGMSLLGCTAAFRLMNVLHAHPAAASDACSASLEILAGTVRIWAGSSVAEKCSLDEDLRRTVIERCLHVTKSSVGMMYDPGYGSMSDCDDDEGATC